MEAEIINFVHGSIYNVRPEQLVPDKNQARQYFSPEAHAELTKTVSAHGLIQPITATLFEGKLQIVAGERRWNAAKAAGLEFVQVKFVDKNVAAISLIENLQRENLLPIEKAVGLQRLKEQHSYTNEQLADIIGKSAPTVCEILTLTNLPDDIRLECGKSKRYVHSRLLAIAKAPDTRSMRKQFFDYKSELDGTDRSQRQRDPSKMIDGLISRISGIITQIDKIGIERLNNKERTRLADKLEELEFKAQEKAHDISRLETSDFRSFDSEGQDAKLTTVDGMFDSGLTSLEGPSSEVSYNDDTNAEDELIVVEPAPKEGSVPVGGAIDEASYDHDTVPSNVLSPDKYQ